MLQKSWLPVAFIIAQMAVASLAQQPAGTPTPPPVPQKIPRRIEPEDVVKITTNLVQVDAVVTDKSGKPVTDLNAEEIEVFEDGRKQRITNFSYILAETPPEAAPPAKTERPDRSAPPVPPTRIKREDIKRTIAIVVDDLGLSFESTYYVRRALKKFVDEQMQPGDLIAIIRSSGGMGALQQFTTDKRQLYAAIERVKWNSLGRGDVSAFAPIQPPTPGDQGADIDAANEDFNQFREDVFAVGTLGAISYVVKGLRELPGRKSILLVSDGFRIYSRDDPTKNFLALQRLRTLIDEAGRSSVVIYTMNATGLQTLGFTAADDLSGRDAQQLEQALSNRRTAAFETQEGLDYLAQQTGGIAIRNTNDLSGGIRRIMNDQRGYYLIGYRPDPSTFDPRTGRRQFHKLSMKVLRPGKFNVRMRNGFFGVTDEEAHPTQRTLAQQMVGALASPFGATGVHVQLTSLFSNDPKAGSYMRSLLHVDARDLTFTEESNHLHKTVFDILAMTFGDNGVLVEKPVGRTYTLELPDDQYKRAVRDGLVYYLTVPIKKPGAYQLRMSFRDSSSERIGSASQFVEVPDLKKNRLALSGVVLQGELPRTKSSAASSSGTPATEPNQNPASVADTSEGVEKGNAEASPAVRHFRPGMLLDYSFYIFNARSDKATGQPQLTSQIILFRDGKPAFTGKEFPVGSPSQPDMKQLVAGGAIKIGTDLAPGEYVLQIIVKDALADEKHRAAHQWMDFEIVR
jgi:VWFA-related protein